MNPPPSSSDLDRLPGLPSGLSERLAQVGIASVADLRAATPIDLAGELAVPIEEAERWVRLARETPLLTDVPGIGPTTAAKFEAAGIATVQALSNAVPVDVAPLVGLSIDRVATFRERAEKLLASLPPPSEEGPDASSILQDAQAMAVAARSVADAAAKAAEEFKVILTARSRTARVRVGRFLYEDVPIVVARASENIDEVRARVQHDAVILQERAGVAVARLRDAWHENLPLVEARVADVAGAVEPVVEEVRVKVMRLKERVQGTTEAGAPRGPGSA